MTLVIPERKIELFHTVLGFGQTMVGSGSTCIVSAYPPYDHVFKPTQLLIDPIVAESFSIVDIKIGCMSHFGSPLSEIPAFAFTPRLKDRDVATKFDWLTADRGHHIAMTVRNHSCAKTLFEASLFGAISLDHEVDAREIEAALKKETEAEGALKKKSGHYEFEDEEHALELCPTDLVVSPGGEGYISLPLNKNIFAPKRLVVDPVSAYSFDIKEVLVGHTSVLKEWRVKECSAYLPASEFGNNSNCLSWDVVYPGTEVSIRIKNKTLDAAVFKAHIMAKFGKWVGL